MHREPVLENGGLPSTSASARFPLGFSKLLASETNHPKTLLLRHFSKMG